MTAALRQFLFHRDRNRFAKTARPLPAGGYQLDTTIDASLCAVWYFGVLAPDDPAVIATMRAVQDRLWIKTPVGGCARYEADLYHQAEHHDLERVPGNPWFICTLWLAQYRIATARTVAELQPAREILDWVVAHALPSGVLAEQIHPYTHEPLSVSPLTWSHAEFVSAVLALLEKHRSLTGMVPKPAG